MTFVDKHRGFGFVEFDLEEDASDAIENMDGAELFGKVIRCNIARQIPKMDKGKAVWSAEEWIQSSMQDPDGNGNVATGLVDTGGEAGEDLEPAASLVPAGESS